MELKWVLVLTLMILPSTYGGLDNTGTEFILMFLENSLRATDPTGADGRIRLFLTTSKADPVNVDISCAGIGFTSNVNVSDGSFQTVEVDTSIRLTETEKVADKGLLITADDEITVYIVNMEGLSVDGSLIIPTEALGTEYITTGWTPERRTSLFGIAGTVDGTNVVVKATQDLTIDGTLHSAGTNISLTLNRLEAFQASSETDLSGTEIFSDQPVAVFSGNKKTRVTDGASSNTADHLEEMLIPITQWGTEFYSTPTPGTTSRGNYLRITASEDNTAYTITGTGGYSSSGTLVGRGTFDDQLIPAVTYVKVSADKPVSVFKFALSQTTGTTEPADPAMILLVPRVQWKTNYEIITPPAASGTYEHFMALVVENGREDTLLLDETALNTTGYEWNNITGSDYVGTWLPLTEGAHVISNSDSVGAFSGFLFGKQTAESYGVPLGMRNELSNTDCTETTMVTGDGVDNDCDGRIDEEQCTSSPTDDDEDGDNDEDCAAPNCGTPPTDANAVITGSNYFYPNSVTYTCNENCTIQGTSDTSESIQCQEDGTWTAHTPCDCSSGGGGGDVAGDPHVMINIKGVEKPICFDFIAPAGKVIQLLSVPSKDLVVNAKMVTMERDWEVDAGWAYYLGEAVIRLGDFWIHVGATTHYMNIGGKVEKWSPKFQRNYVAKFGNEEINVAARIMKQDRYRMAVHIGNLATIVIARFDNHLDVLVTKLDESLWPAGGIVGQAMTMEADLTVDEEDKETGQLRYVGFSKYHKMKLRNRTKMGALGQQTDYFGHRVDCWHKEGIPIGTVHDFKVRDLYSRKTKFAKQR